MLEDLILGEYPDAKVLAYGPRRFSVLLGREEPAASIAGSGSTAIVVSGTPVPGREVSIYTAQAGPLGQARVGVYVREDAPHGTNVTWVAVPLDGMLRLDDLPLPATGLVVEFEADRLEAGDAWSLCTDDLASAPMLAPRPVVPTARVTTPAPVVPEVLPPEPPRPSLWARFCLWLACVLFALARRLRPEPAPPAESIPAVPDLFIAGHVGKDSNE